MTAYEMRFSDWSSDLCSSDLEEDPPLHELRREQGGAAQWLSKPVTRLAVARRRRRSPIACARASRVPRSTWLRHAAKWASCSPRTPGMTAAARCATSSASRCWPTCAASTTSATATTNDRKSVVKGKSESVSVALGGRRYIKNYTIDNCLT